MKISKLVPDEDRARENFFGNLLTQFGNTQATPGRKLMSMKVRLDSNSYKGIFCNALCSKLLSFIL